MSGLGILHIMKVNDEPSDLCARALATVVGNQDPEQLALKMYVLFGHTVVWRCRVTARRQSGTMCSMA